MSHEEADLVGAALGGFTLTRHLAEGSMGHVYVATRPEAPGREFAVKVLHTDLLGQPEVAFRFRREAEILSMVKSPYVPRLCGRGRDPRGRPYFALELAEGRDLSTTLGDTGALEVESALEIAVQVARALGAAHGAGIVHRDVKPENIMVAGPLSQPRVMLLDFSVSKDEDLALTQQGAILGTPSYMAPEQAMGEPVTPLVDVYALGAVLYDMLTGQPPYDGEDPGRVLAMLLTRDPPKPRELVATIPQAVEAVVLKAIARKPADRYATMADLERALEALCKYVPAEASIESLPFSAPSSAPSIPDLGAVVRPSAPAESRAAPSPPPSASSAAAAPALERGLTPRRAGTVLVLVVLAIAVVILVAALRTR
ncbi:MAG: serine/threonine-protein kinase [Polyangiaceae bacterium]